MLAALPDTAPARIAPWRLAPLPDPDHRSGEPPVRGEALLRLLERPFHWLEAPFARALPEHLNPIAQAGAVANTCLIVALVTGVLLLVWYVPSVNGAHASVESMVAAPWTAGLVRSLHRYSSDAAMAFILLHAARVFVARRFAGARWLAWITGLPLLGLTWLVGWTGYWLVWDEGAREIALTTARFLDVLPIFVDPMSRSFLTDESVNSLLFFVVFFVHMLLPLAMGVALWLHLARLARARLLTSRAMTACIIAGLVVASIAVPAISAAPARMAHAPSRLVVDAWYLAPVIVAEHLSAGAAWGLMLVAGLALASVPWSLVRGRTRVASVVEWKCHACSNCVTDCPFAAITMGPRGAPHRADQVATVDAARCVGCGICSASCEPGAITLPWDQPLLERRRVDAWLERAIEAGDAPVVIFGCAGSAADSLSVDSTSGRCAEIPGARVMIVPCTGWIHALSLERALRRGASGVLVVGCPPGACRFREGDRWFHERTFGRREPSLRRDKADGSRIRHVNLPPGRVAELVREAASAGTVGAGARPRRVPWLIAALGVLFLGSAAIVAGTRLPYSPAAARVATLIVSLRQAGQVVERCRDLSPEELAALPAHMRQPRRCTRGRAPIRVRVEIDGQVVLSKAFPAAGVWSDGKSFAVDSVDVPPGERQVSVAIADGALVEDDLADETAWRFGDSRRLTFRLGENRVVRIENGDVSWH